MRKEDILKYFKRHGVKCSRTWSGVYMCKYGQFWKCFESLNTAYKYYQPIFRKY